MVNCPACSQKNSDRDRFCIYCGSQLTISSSNPGTKSDLSTNKQTSKPIEIFFSYSHKDESFREQLETHLSMLKRQGLIKPWHDRMITAGDEWKGQIDDNLNAADVVLLLVSANFLASDYCYDIEMKRAMERHETGDARVVPIILTPVEGWMHSPFAKLQVFPKDGKPVTKWGDRDEAFVNVAQGIRQVIDLFSQSSSRAGETIKNTAPEPASQFNVSSDYIVLSKLLGEGRWNKADEETCKVMLRLTGKSNWTDIVLEDVKHIPQSHLDQIEQLWSQNSGGKFGFKAQKAVWQSVGGKLNIYEHDLFQKFSELLGWRSLSAGKYEYWLPQKELDFSLQASNGHLPSALSPAITHSAIVHPDSDGLKAFATNAGVTMAGGLALIFLTGGIGTLAIALSPVAGLGFAATLAALRHNRLKLAGQLFLALLSRF